MAATQTESQQNDVNSEKVQPDQHLNVRNSNSLLQNGTDKSSSLRGGASVAGGVVVAKAKGAGPGSQGPSAKGLCAGDMSQYRAADGGPGAGGTAPSGPAPAPTPGTPAADHSAGGDDMGPGLGAADGYAAEGGPPPPQPPPQLPPDGHGYNFTFGAEGGMHHPFAAAAAAAAAHRQAFGAAAGGPGPKQPPGGPAGPPPQQPGAAFSQQQSPPQRFVSGQTISQPTGPTPTLNRLLEQSSNPIHRYPNNYEQSYNPGWPSQNVRLPGAPYRNQSSLSAAYGGVPSPSPGYAESRGGGGGGWSGPPGPGQHGPGSPGPPPSAMAPASASSVPASQPSPQPSQPPSHSPGPGLPPSPSHQPPPNQHQGFPSRPAQPTTPNAHAPDQADLSGGNSNDSSGGPAPGTPNSQGMRPTPSPTGSTGSRSMSPAVGQQNIPMPPRPSSGQSDGSGSTRMSHSPMSTQGSYPPQHMHAYKGHPGMVPPASQQMPIYQQNPQYQQGAYPARPQYPNQGYGPPASQQPPPNNSMSPQQYPNLSRSTPNHMANTQFPPYQQSWSGGPGGSGPVGTGNHLPSKGNGPPPPAPNSPAPGSTRPPHYLKQHLQHKMGFANTASSMPPSPSPPHNYHMGPPPVGHHHSGMGPPPSMGPPNMPPATSPLLPNNHPHDGPMPPPSSTPNSHHQMPPDMMDNGITTTAASNLSTHVTAASGGSVTSVVTTGPDGTPIDEGSQQSTLSNASAASGEDPQCTTPKSRKNDMGHYSHPTTPQSTVPSPGATSIIQEEYGEISSPSWPRTPASPVFNSHVPPQETYRSKKTDSLSKLYDMDDSPDRRAWLDKLLSYMEDRRTPITTCPTISKNPLDLFRLYMYVKDRGGFMEVTKNKTWKDIAGMLGIGASSSAAYTLRKHYTKNLLAYECQYDRGGIDPQPIINQVEASSKKKSTKAASVPSPGSSNSQDSFPAAGSGGASMDGYGGYAYPPGGANPDYNAPPQRPSSQANAPSPHGGAAGSNHLGNAAPGGPSPAGGASDNVNVSNPFDDISPSPPPRGGGPFPGAPHPPYPAGSSPRPQGQPYSGQSGSYNQYPGSGSGAPPDQYSSYPSGGQGYPATRPVYPPYSGDSGAPPPSNTSTQPGAPPPGPQDPFNRYNISNAPGSGYTPRPGYTGAPGATGPPGSQPPGGPYPPPQDYYRPDQPGSTPGNYPGGPPPNKNMPPPANHPRRHPDFAKEQNYQYGQQRPPMYGGWPNNTQFRSGYPPASGAQQWSQSGGRPPGPGQWDRYPAPNQGYQATQQGQPQQWSPMPPAGVGQSSPLRPPIGPRPCKFNMIQPQCGKGTQQPTTGSNSYPPKREITFPPESVEATLPVLYRRKRICRADLGPVDAWRIIMCLRSGLLAESCFALDMLSVLLFDDSSVQYFGLNQWPGLLDLLLEHFRKSLADTFDGPYPPEEKQDDPEIDLGAVDVPIDLDSKTVILSKTNNYTFLTRKNYQVKLVEKNEDIFIHDHHKSWDTKGDAAGINVMAEIITDPWHLTAEHIVPTFQAEFERIPFNRRLDEKKEVPVEKEELVKAEPCKTCPPEVIPSTKPSDKKRRTKTLSDVISRIKKEPTDENDLLALDIKIKSESNETLLVSVPSENCQEQQSEKKSDSSAVDLNSVNGVGASETDTTTGSSSTSLSSASVSSAASSSTIRDVAGSLKRRRMSDYEDEAYARDEASLVLATESQDCVGKRCVCISNILRSLTFVPGNETEFAKSNIFLGLVGKLLLLHHEHPVRTQKTKNYDREEDADFTDSCSSLQGASEWWWEFLLHIRENVLVCTANIAGQIDLDAYPEEVARPLLDGLLHWAICPSAQGQDPFPSGGPSSLLSPQRLALEALCKLCVTNSNVDLVIATPPFSRLERLCAVLTKHLCRSEDQVLREFSINLLHYLAAADSSMARVVALQAPCVSLLVAFIEQAEQSAMGVANQHGIGALRDNPDSMGTSLDMLRRAASTLVFLAEHPENRPLLVQQESRLLALVMSQILDQQVALLLSKVLYKISHS